MKSESLLRELVAIDSVNPALVPGAAGETQVARFIERWLDERGLAHQWIEPVPGRPSIVSHLKGSAGGPTLMLNGHIDVVGVEGYQGDPFIPETRGGRLYGRGSSDMKSGVAAMMMAFERLRGADLRGDVILACVADEEHASIGTQAILDAGVRADAAIVCEPVGYELVTAHKGFIWFDVEFRGRAAHGSRPDKGVDAIVKAGKFLSALEDYAQDLADRPSHPRLGNGSVHASLIEGGNELSTYPAHCKLSLERRTVPGETGETVRAELEAIIQRLSESDQQFDATLISSLERNPYACPENAPIQAVVEHQAERVTGRVLGRSVMNGWTDCGLLGAAGIHSVLIGPGGTGGHSAEESVDLASVDELAEIIYHVALEYCR
ncbi:ArgE/DapE family deacylase [Pacificimonas sp. WHA3]|uniref:Probable succinyl-diaminopimelate desuccinylase n=1 Tax=Pacificimonas pallii TaxID=2827236 RepID=A0ABS6SCI4_9SPHN|nr:ArgE/DapE family deacylase [Pacificimonas pallii]MBV7256133.1 ArgE/DapE family deacylase [Pacificimonas pallii]